MYERYESSRAPHWAALGAILAAGIMLRSFRLDWGLPKFVFFDSMVFYAMPAQRLLNEGAWRAVSFVHPPATGSALALVALTWAALRGIPATMLTIPQLELLGRVMTVTFSTASIVVLHALTRRLVGSRAALLAAAAFALSPVHVLEAHRTNSDAPMLLLTLIAIHQATIARDAASTGRLAAAFTFAGAAAAVKYSGLAAVTVPAWVALTWPESSLRRRVVLLATGGTVALLALIVGVSPLLAQRDELFATIEKIRVVGMSMGQPGHDLRGQGWVYTRYVYALVAALPYMLGWSVYIAARAGLYLLRHEQRARGPVFAFVAPFFLFQGAAETVVPRYYLPLAPLLCLAAGLALDHLWQRLGVRGALVAVAVLSYTLAFTASLCLRIPGPANAVGAALRAEIARATAAGRPLVLAYENELRRAYDPLSPVFVGRRAVRVVPLPDDASSKPAQEAIDGFRSWLDSKHIDAVLLTEWRAGIARREGRTAELAVIAALRGGRLGFRRTAEARSGYFTESLYTWADPSFATDVASGIIDHELFVRDTAPTGPPPAEGEVPAMP